MAEPSHVVDLRGGAGEDAPRQESAPSVRAPISWEAPEFSQKGGSQWLFGMALVALALFGWALWTLNYLFALFIAVGAITLVIWEKKPVRVHEFKVEEGGIWIDEKFWPIDSLASFWLFRFPETSLLSFKQRSRMASPIRIPVSQDISDSVVHMLRQHLSEEEDTYSFVDMLADRFHL